MIALLYCQQFKVEEVIHGPSFDCEEMYFKNQVQLFVIRTPITEKEENNLFYFDFQNTAAKLVTNSL